MPATVSWVKGHGTRNDFVLLDDPDGTVFGDLDPALVQLLCDRRDGVGGDGVLRVMATSAGPDWQRDGAADWFMDYRNADGSVAQMCGNGVRVFAQYLLATGRIAAGEPVAVATRSGIRTATPQPPPAPDPAGETGGVPGAGWWSVDMGSADVVRYQAGDGPLTVATGAGQPARPAVGVDVGNPHAVVLVDDVADAGPLANAPLVDPVSAFPDGVNVEFVARTGPAAFDMRVFERGVGETPSCGTGICAAAAAVHASGNRAGDPGCYDVHVPGGRLVVEVAPAGPDRFSVRLTGPAVLVGEGRLTRWSWPAPGDHAAPPGGIR